MAIPLPANILSFKSTHTYFLGFASLSPATRRLMSILHYSALTPSNVRTSFQDWVLPLASSRLRRRPIQRGDTGRVTKPGSTQHPDGPHGRAGRAAGLRLGTSGAPQAPGRMRPHARTAQQWRFLGNCYARLGAGAPGCTTRLDLSGDKQVHQGRQVVDDLRQLEFLLTVVVVEHHENPLQCRHPRVV